MCVLHFQCICCVVKYLPCKLTGQLCLAFLQPALLTYALVWASKPMLCILLCLLFHEESKKAVSRLVRKITVRGEIGEQPGAPSKTLVCLLQVCSVTGKIEHAAYFFLNSLIIFTITSDLPTTICSHAMKNF